MGKTSRRTINRAPVTLIRKKTGKSKCCHAQEAARKCGRYPLLSGVARCGVLLSGDTMNGRLRGVPRRRAFVCNRNEAALRADDFLRG